MKKILFFAAAVAALLTSCNKEHATQDFEEVSTVYATFAQDNSTKVVMGESDGTNTPLNWNKDDEIVVVNANNMSYGKYQTASSVQDGDSRAKFVFVDGTQINPSVRHFAVYPYDRISPDRYSFEYESKQDYVENSFDPDQMPLVAANAGGTNFTFNAQAAVVRLKVSTATSDVKVISIELSSATKALTGFADADMGTATYGVPVRNQGKTTTLVCPDGGVAINGTAKEFNIVVPGQTYPSGDLTITVKTNKGIIEKTSKAEATFAAGKVYNINVSGDPVITGTAKRTGNVDVRWFQLWAGGPRFAEYNVAAENNEATDFGGYYCWGSSISKDPENKYKEGYDALTGDDDTATKLWGSNWRMFTQAELHALLDSCTVTWTDNYKGSEVKGRIFTGQGAFASNSIFLPASGDCYNGAVHYVGEFGSYRSSTPNTGSTQLFVYYIFFKSNEASATEGGREYGFPVRAVLK